MPSIFVQVVVAQTAAAARAGRARARSAVEPLTPDEIRRADGRRQERSRAGRGLAPHRAIGLLAVAARPEVAMPVLAAIARDPSLGPPIASPRSTDSAATGDTGGADGARCAHA